MSTPSVIRACQLKVAGLTAGDFPGGALPSVYFAEAPQTNAAGGQVQPTTAGYVVLRHNGTQSRAFAYGTPPVTRDVVRLEFEAFYPTLADSLTAMNAIKAGLDYGTLPDLDPALKLLSIRPRSDQPERAGLGKTGGVVHSWKYGVDIELLRGT